MNKNEFIQELLIELSYRSDEGYPILTKGTHISILSEILDEWGLSDIKNELINNLLEAEGESSEEDKKYKGIGGQPPMYVKAGEYEKWQSNPDGFSGQRFKKTEGGKYVSVDGDGEGGEAEGPKVSIFDKDYDAPDIKKKDDTQKPVGNEVFTKISEDNVKTQNSFIKNGFKSGAAPGNAGSMYNEIMSSRVSEYFLENPTATEQDAYNHIKQLEDGGELAQQNNKSTNRPGRITANDTKPYEGNGDSNELIAKRLIAIRSAKRKAEKVDIANSKLGWENTKTLNFFGDAKGLKAMSKSVESASGIVDQNGNPISKEEALELVKTSGGGENPSDTGTVIINNNTGVITMLFHSDKDSTAALIAQSTFGAEVEQGEKNIDKLVSDGRLTAEQAQNIKETRKGYARRVEATENKLNDVTSSPAKFLRDGIGNTIQSSQAVNLLKNASAGADPAKYWKSQVEKRFSNPNLLLPPKDGEPRKRVSDYLPEGVTEPNDEQMVEAYIKWCSDDSWGKSEESLPKNDQKLINDMNTNFGGPDVLEEIDKIRRETIEIQEQMITELDSQTKIEIDGKSIGLGTYLEAQNIWEKGHFTTINADRGVFKYEGMFEVNNGGVPIGPEELKGCANIEDENDFISHFEVGAVEEVSGKEGGVTGSKKLVYAITKKGNRIPIMEKRQRSKNGILGRLNSVYGWSKEMQNCFDSKSK